MITGIPEFLTPFLTPSLYDIIGVVAFIISLSAFRLGRQPRYLLKSTELISRQQVDRHMPDLQMLYKNLPLDKVTLTEVLFWNNGLSEIKSADFASKNPLRIDVAGASGGKILQVRMATTFPHNGVRIETGNSEGQKRINFDHIAYADGFALEVLHSGELVLEGVMTNGKNAKQVAEPPGCAAIIFFAGTFVLCVALLIYESLSLVLSSVICLAAAVYFWNARPHPRKFRRFMEARKMVDVAFDPESSDAGSPPVVSPPSSTTPPLPTSDEVRRSADLLAAAQTSAQDLRHTAQDAIKAEEFIRACDLLTQACALSPGDNIFFLEAGIVALRCEKIAEAEALLEQGMSLPTKDASLLFAFAFARGIAAQRAGRDDARALSAMKQYAFQSVNTNLLKQLIDPISALDQTTQSFYRTILADMRNGRIDRARLSKYRPSVLPMGLDKPWPKV